MAEVGALSLKIQETGGQVLIERLRQVDDAAKNTGTNLKAAAQAASTLGSASSSAGMATTTAFKGAAAATQTLTAAEKALQKEIAEGTRLFALQARLVDVTSATAVRELRASANAQREWLRAIGASTEQQARFNLAVQQFEKRVGAVASATKQQTAGTKELGSAYTKADGSLTAFSKSGIRALNGLAFAFSQFANQGEASLRTVAGQLTSVLSLMGKFGAIGSIVSTVGLAVFDVIRAGQKRAIDRMALDRATAIRNTLTIQKAALDLADTQQEFAYSQGLSGLRTFYDQRNAIIRARTQAEIDAREKQAAAFEAEAAQRLRFVQIAGRDLPDALRGETLEQADRLNAQAKVARAEAKAARDQGAAEEIRNTQARLAAEKALADQVRGFDAARLEIQGKTHQARLQQIEVEAAAYRKALQQQGGADVEARVKAFTDAMRAQANMQEQQTALALIQTQLDTQRLAIQQDLEAGRISEAEAAQRTADAETSMLPTMRELVQRALEFAAALGDEGALTALKRIRQELEGLGRNVELDGLRRSLEQSVVQGLTGGFTAAFDAAFRRQRELNDLRKEASALRKPVPGETGTEEKARLKELKKVMAEIQQIQKTNVVAEGFKAMGRAWLGALGGMLVMIGQRALIASALIKKVVAGILTLNPVAGAAAALALIAFGSLLQGMASGSGGSGGRGGSFSSGASAGGGSEDSRIFVAQAGSARRQQSASALGGMQAAPAMHPVTINLGTWSATDPGVQRLVATTVQNAQRRGY